MLLIIIEIIISLITSFIGLKDSDYKIVNVFLHNMLFVLINKIDIFLRRLITIEKFAKCNIFEIVQIVHLLKSS